MATGTWEDFTGKYGFGDGATVEGRDFKARARLLEMLNDHEAMRTAGLKALGYDRPGLHNPCMVIVVQGHGKPARELLKLWKTDEVEEAPLPDAVELEISEMVAEAYKI